MTAVLGCLAADAGLERMHEAAAGLLHVPWQRASIVPVAAGVGIGGIWLANRPDLLSVHQAPMRTVVLAGWARVAGRRVDASGIDALLQRDYPVLQAALLLFAATFAIINLLTDLSYLFLDPSLEYS